MIIRKQRKRIIDNIIRFVKFSVLHVDDSPHRIALGVGLGLFVAFMPPLGEHIFVVLGLCFIFRANKFVGLTFIWASNPFTYVLLYYPNCLLGRAIFAHFHMVERLDAAEVDALFKNSLSLSRVVSGFHTAEFWRELWGLLVQVGVEMFIGGLVIGSFVAAAAYLGTYNLVIWYRRQHPHRHLSRTG